MRVEMVAPCSPYAAASLRHGPFQITYETSDLGAVSIRLPQVAGQIEARIGGDVLTLAMGAATPPQFLAIGWTASATVSAAPDLQTWTIGSGDGQLTVLAAQPGQALPGQIAVTLDPDVCGGRLEGRLISPDGAREMSLTLPRCDANGLTVALPLAALAGLPR